MPFQELTKEKYDKLRKKYSHEQIIEFEKRRRAEFVEPTQPAERGLFGERGKIAGGLFGRAAEKVGSFFSRKAPEVVERLGLAGRGEEEFKAARDISRQADLRVQMARVEKDPERKKALLKSAGEMTREAEIISGGGEERLKTAEESTFLGRPAKVQEILKKDIPLAERLFQAGGEAVAVASDVIGEALTSIPGMEAGIKAIGRGIDKLTPEELDLKVKDFASDILQKWRSLEETNPRAAGYLRATGQFAELIADMVGFSAGKKVTKETAKQFIKKGDDLLGLVGKGVVKAGEKLEESAERLIKKEALDVINPAPFISGKEFGEQFIKGATKPQRTFLGKKSVITPEARIINNKLDDVAESVRGIVGKGKTLDENRDLIRQAIAKEADDTISVLEKIPSPFNDSQLRSALNKAKDKSKLIFARDKSLENSYNAVMDKFFEILKQTDEAGNRILKNTQPDLLKARKLFDSDPQIKRIIDSTDFADVGSNIQKNAVRDIRMAVNNFIADNTDELGKEFKDLLRNQSLKFEAIELMGIKASSLGGVQKIFEKIKTISRNKTLLTLLAGGITGGGLVLTAPEVVIPSMLIGGLFKVGEKTITSKSARQILSNILEQAGKGAIKLSQAEKSSINQIISQLGGVAGAGVIPATRKGLFQEK